MEDKPEVKKAGGVYYTPAFIVEYIVKNTVGKILEGKSVWDKGIGGKGEALRVLDPACGSGSFLLGAYQYLLDWHRDAYVAEGAEKWAKGKKPTIYQIHWRRVEADHCRAQAHLARAHLRRGHRPAGRGGDQALALIEGAGRRERRRPWRTSSPSGRSALCPTWEKTLSAATR